MNGPNAVVDFLQADGELLEGIGDEDQTLLEPKRATRSPSANHARVRSLPLLGTVKRLRNMRQLVPLILAVLLPSALLAAEPTPGHRKAIEAAETLGRAIYEQDVVAARATDALLAAASGESRSGLMGWIVTGTSARPVVQFIGKAGDVYVTQFDIVFRDGQPPQVNHLVPARELQGDDLGMFLARQAAVAAIPSSRCSKKYNPIVLPNSGDGGNGWLVYLLAATTNEHEVLIGGHYRATASRNDGKLLSFEPLSNSCLTLSTVGEHGGSVIALVMSQVLTDTPIETHVYLNLLHKITFYVMTEPGMWAITDGSITYVGPRPEPKGR